MRNFKKILAIVLSVLFVVPSMAFGSFADNAADVNEFWHVDSANAVSANANGAGVTASETDPAADGTLIVSSLLKSEINGNAYVVNVAGADVDNDGNDDYPSALSFVWTTTPDNHNGLGNVASQIRAPLANNALAYDAAMSITIVDYAFLSDQGYTYDNQTAGDHIGDIVFWRIYGPTGAEWATSTFTLNTPVDFSQPISINAFSAYDDFEGDWINGVVINGEELIIPGCGNAFNGTSNGTPNNLDKASFNFVVGALTDKFGASNDVNYATAGLTVTPAGEGSDGHNHVYGEFTLATEGDCANYADYVALCAICGEEAHKSGTTLAEHTWDEGVITRVATCNKTEKTTYTCTVCGATKEETTGEKLPHNYVDIDDPEINKDPTCTEDGAQRQECDQREPHHFRTVTIPALGHNVETWTTVQEGDCTHASIKEGECTRCHEIVCEEGEVGGHTYVLTGIHEGKAYYTCTACDDITSEELDAKGNIVDTDGKDKDHRDAEVSENSFWTVTTDNKVGTNMGIGTGYNDWYYTGIDADGNISTWDLNYNFRDYPATAAANTRMLSKYADDINGFTATLKPIPAWILESASLKFPWAQNYSFFWTNNPDAYRAASTGTASRGFIKDGSNYAADDRSLEVVFADAAGYDGVADTLIVTATFQGTAYPFTYSINVPFTSELTVEVINTATEFAVIAQGERYDFNDMIGVLSGDMYFGAQASTDWVNNAAVRALSADFAITSINGAAGTATWAGNTPVLDHEWSDWTETQPADCQHYATLTRTCALCGQTETQEGTELGEHNYVVSGIHEGKVHSACSVCGDPKAEAISGGTLYDEDGNMIQHRQVSGTEAFKAENELWTASAWNTIGTAVGAAGYDHTYYTGIKGGALANYDVGYEFGDQPASNLAANQFVSKSTTEIDGFSVNFTPVFTPSVSNGIPYAQNYSVMFTNTPDLYTTAQFTGLGWLAAFAASGNTDNQGRASNNVENSRGFLASGAAHDASELTFEVVLADANSFNTAADIADGTIGTADYLIGRVAFQGQEYTISYDLETPISFAAPITVEIINTASEFAVVANGQKYAFGDMKGVMNGEFNFGIKAQANWDWNSAARFNGTSFELNTINGYDAAAWAGSSEMPHQWGEWTASDDTHETRTCALCGEIETREITPSKAYTLTFDANGGTIDGEASVSFPIDYMETYGSATGWEEIHVPVREGYTFTGWVYAGVYTLGSLNDQYGLQSDGTFVAQWEEIKTAVNWYLDMTGHAFTNDPMTVGDTFSAKGIATGGIKAIEVYDNGTEAETSSRGNKKYFSYFLEDETELVDGETVITEAMVGTHTITVVLKEDTRYVGETTLTIEAAPVQKDYTLTFDANGGTIDGEASISFGINAGETYRSATGWDAVHVPVREGYIFDGWSYLGVYYLTDSHLDDQYGLTSDGTFVAEWIADKPYTLTFDANGGTIDGAASVSFPIATGDSYASATGWEEIHVPVREHYEFKGWVYGGFYTLNNVDETYGLESNGTFVAQWELKKEYNVTFDANGGKVNGEDSITFPIGYMETYESATGMSEVPVPERAGFEFLGWFYEPYNYQLNNMGEQFAVTTDAAFTAHWQELPVADVDGFEITLHDYNHDVKDAFLISGHFDSYKDIKAARASASYYYGVAAAKLAANDYTHVFTVNAAGEYTLLVRYISDGFEDYTYYNIVIKGSANVTTNGHTVTATFAGKEAKSFRFAPGAGLTTVAEIKRAEGYIGLNTNSTKYYNADSKTFTYNVKELGTYSYVAEFADGSTVAGEFTIEEPASRLPTITADGVTGDWSQIVRIKYAPGTLTTAAEFRGADGLRVLYAPEEGNTATYRQGTLTGAYSFLVIFTDGTQEIGNLTF